MSKKKISYRYQTMLLDNLQNDYMRMKEDDNNVGIAKKILVQMRYFMMHYDFEDEIVEKLSLLVDEITNSISNVPIIERKDCDQAAFTRH